uniref:Uncharacterized protein n=1 Tax=Ananas comosus var. bracteatus TaxID=296719 RepID=A0A6V7Q9K3_ANACO|nr:unnamed protein product [Ananas comosus var. bracteatus]
MPDQAEPSARPEASAPPDLIEQLAALTEVIKQQSVLLQRIYEIITQWSGVETGASVQQALLVGHGVTPVQERTMAPGQSQDQKRHFPDDGGQASSRRPLRLSRSCSQGRGSSGRQHSRDCFSRDRHRGRCVFPASTVGVPARSRRRSVGLQRDLVRWIQDFERKPRSPYLPNLVKVSLVVSLFFSAAVALGRFEGHYGFLCLDPWSVVAVPDCWGPSGLTVDPDTCKLVGRARECHSGMRFQCDECRSFCWTVLEPATLGVVYGTARYRQGGSVLGSPGEMVSDAFPYLLVRL